MSDDLLPRELIRLSQMAEASATPTSAGAVIRRARARRRRRHLAAAAVPVVVVALVVGVALAQTSAPHPPAGVSSAAAGQARGASGRLPAAGRGAGKVAGPRGVKGTSTSSRPAAGANRGVKTTGPGDRHEGPPSQTEPAITGPANLRDHGSAQFGGCVGPSDQMTARPVENRPSPLRSGPVSVTAVWKPKRGGVAGCGWTEATTGQETARRLLAAIRATKPWTGSRACPTTASDPGSLELVFTYREGPPAIVTMTLDGCRTLTLPGHVTRDATPVPIKALDPPAWVGAGVISPMAPRR